MVLPATGNVWKARATVLARTGLELLKRTFPFHAAAWKASSEPIQKLLEEGDSTRRDQLTAIWRDTSQTQLNAIGVTSALFGGVIASSFTWPALTTLSASTLSSIHVIWYSALVLALTSIATSAQQAVALSRLSSYPDGMRRIREVLGKQVDGGWKPRKLQLVIWQTPLSLLNTSIVMFAVGLSVVVWKSVSWSWAWDDIKVVTIFTVAFVYAIVLYVLSAFGLYHRIAQT